MSGLLVRSGIIEFNFSDRQEGSMVSSIIRKHWWLVKILALKYYWAGPVDCAAGDHIPTIKWLLISFCFDADD